MKVTNYGDMLSQVTGKPCIDFICFGSYQGEWVALLDSGEDVELWKGSYGSCSGCDWLEAERNWTTDEVSDEKAREFFKEDRPFLAIPKHTIRDMSLETFEQIFPANVRKDIYEFDVGLLFKSLKQSLPGA